MKDLKDLVYRRVSEPLYKQLLMFLFITFCYSTILCVVKLYSLRSCQSKVVQSDLDTNT